MGAIESDRELKVAQKALKRTIEDTGWSKWRIENYAFKIHDQHLDWELADAIYYLREIILYDKPRLPD